MGEHLWIRHLHPPTPPPLQVWMGEGGYHPYPPTPYLGHGGWGAQGGGGYPRGPLQLPGMGALGFFDVAVHIFAAALQGVVTSGMEAPPPPPAAPEGRVTALSILHLRFACGVAGDGEMSPIWEAVTRGKGRTESLATLNQMLMRGITSCSWVFFWEGAHFSASLPLHTFIKNVSLCNPSLYPACTGGSPCGSCARQRLRCPPMGGSTPPSFK